MVIVCGSLKSGVPRDRSLPRCGGSVGQCRLNVARAHLVNVGSAAADIRLSYLVFIAISLFALPSFSRRKSPLFQHCPNAKSRGTIRGISELV